MKTQTTGVKIAKLFLTLVLFLCFVFHIWGQMRKFFARKTMTIEEKKPISQAKMPSMSICSEEPYKKSGFFFNRTSFDEHTFTFEQLFDAETVDRLAEKEFSIKETHSQEMGRCFTIASDYTFHTGDSFKLVFREAGPYPLLVVHGLGGEFWMRANYWPDEVEIDSFDTAVNCIAEPKNELYMSTVGDSKVSCMKWNYQEFFRCAERTWKEAILTEGFTCYTIWWKELFPPDARECTMENDLEEIIRLSEWLESAEEFPFQFSSNPNQFGCPLPCFKSFYSLLCRPNLEKNTYHSLLEGHDETHEGKFELTISLKMIEELEEQVLLFDFSAIVAGVGGSLGLFLGFSCLEVLQPLLNHIASFFRRYT